MQSQISYLCYFKAGGAEALYIIALPLASAPAPLQEFILGEIDIFIMSAFASALAPLKFKYNSSPNFPQVISSIKL